MADIQSSATWDDIEREQHALSLDPNLENIQPSTGRAITEGAAYLSSPAIALGKAAERGFYSTSSIFDKFLAAQASYEEPAYKQKFNNEPLAQPITPTLSPEEANNFYSPEGKKIFDKPIEQGLAALIGKQATETVQREDLLNRYTSQNNPLVNFGVGIAGSVLDPLNVGSMFVPGIGSEWALERVGASTGLLGRIVARGMLGASEAVTGQLPLVGLKYGLSKEEAQDYSLFDAFKDLAGMAALGAAQRIAIGGIFSDDVSRQQKAAQVEADNKQGIARIEGSMKKWLDAQTNHDALSAAVSQFYEGKSIDVTPILNARVYSQLMKVYEKINEHDTAIATIRDKYAEGEPLSSEDEGLIAGIEQNGLEPLRKQRDNILSAWQNYPTTEAINPETRISELQEQLNKYLVEYGPLPKESETDLERLSREEPILAHQIQERQTEELTSLKGQHEQLTQSQQTEENLVQAQQDRISTIENRLNDIRDNPEASVEELNEAAGLREQLVKAQRTDKQLRDAKAEPLQKAVDLINKTPSKEVQALDNEIGRIKDNPEATPEELNKLEDLRTQKQKLEQQDKQLLLAGFSDKDLVRLQHLESEVARIKGDPEATPEELSGLSDAEKELHDLRVRRYLEKYRLGRIIRPLEKSAEKSVLPDEQFERAVALRNKIEELKAKAKEQELYNPLFPKTDLSFYGREEQRLLDEQLYEFINEKFGSSPAEIAKTQQDLYKTGFDIGTPRQELLKNTQIFNSMDAVLKAIKDNTPAIDSKVIQELRGQMDALVKEIKAGILDDEEGNLMKSQQALDSLPKQEEALAQAGECIARGLGFNG